MAIASMTNWERTLAMWDAGLNARRKFVEPSKVAPNDPRPVAVLKLLAALYQVEEEPGRSSACICDKRKAQTA